MRNMFISIKSALESGEALVIVSIIAASGATPRGIGAHMLVGRCGRICGTIGGGAVEYRAEQTALNVLETKNSEKKNFLLNTDDVQQLGMICGGEVEVLFHYISCGDEKLLRLAEEAERIFAAGSALWMISNINHGGSLSLYTKEDGVIGDECPGWVLERLSGKPARLCQGDAHYCVEQINSAGRVLIFGGGHVSQELEPVLTHVGFRCIVMDDRPEFANREIFPGAEEVRIIDFERIDDYVKISDEDFVCIMTRGHAYDTVLQAQVLRRKPRYVGVIGSRKKAAAVRKKLHDEYGLSEEELNLVTTPIGLAIKAETPAEIAISIAAQLIQIRAGE